MEPVSQVWTPAEYDTTKTPRMESTLKVTSDNDCQSNFPRCAKWCPDGSVLLAQCENSTFQFFDQTAHIFSEPTAEHIYAPARRFSQAAPILDFVWYPTATPRDPASFCFVASVRECPVKLLDASDGRVHICLYRGNTLIVDHRERQIAPHSLAFNLTAQKLYCGFEDAIEVFDITRPGEGTRISTTPSKKSKDGLKGIISSLAFCPSYSPEECFYAAGSFSPTNNNIAMFSDVSSDPVMFIGGGPQAGITQLQFNPMQPNILYAAYRGRGSGSVFSWDIRSNVHSPMEIFQTSTSLGDPEKSRTNQKIRFDIDAAGRLLTIGDKTGNVSLFELNSESRYENAPDSSYESTTIIHPCLSFKAHEDTIGSVAFHPFKPCLLSVSGSRHFTDNYSMSSDEDSGDEIDQNAIRTKDRLRRKKHPQPVTFDSTIKTWDFNT